MSRVRQRLDAARRRRAGRRRRGSPRPAAAALLLGRASGPGSSSGARPRPLRHERSVGYEPEPDTCSCLGQDRADDARRLDPTAPILAASTCWRAALGGRRLARRLGLAAHRGATAAAGLQGGSRARSTSSWSAAASPAWSPPARSPAGAARCWSSRPATGSAAGCSTTTLDTRRRDRGRGCLRRPHPGPHPGLAEELEVRPSRSTTPARASTSPRPPAGSSTPARCRRTRRSCPTPRSCSR